MTRRRSPEDEPPPIQGAQIDVPEAEKPREASHVLAPSERESEIPPADAPTTIVETHLPGAEQVRSREKLTMRQLLVQPLKLLAEGLRPGNLVSSYGRAPLFLIMGIYTMSLFASSALTWELPEIQRAFKINLGAIITMVVWIGFVATLLSVPFGYLGDRKRRTTMYGVGGVISSIGNLFTGFSPGKLGLYGSRWLSEIGYLGPDSVAYSLISDYTPIEDRGKSFAFRNAVAQFGGIAAPLFAGFVGAKFGWRWPFVFAGAIGAALSVWFLKMPEPIRGYHERKAWGADELVARRQQEPPSWGEGFRAAWGVRTLRRYAYATPFENMAFTGLAIYFPLFLARTHNVDLLHRGIYGAIFAFFSLIGLAMGGPLVDRIIGRNPGRAVMINGLAGIIGAFVIVACVFSPLWLVVILYSIGFQMLYVMVLPARYAVNSLVIPPRVRNLGLATLQYWGLPSFFAFPIIAGIANQNGYRSALLIFVPFMIIGSIIVMSGGPYVEFDIRSATSAAMAAEEWRRTREQGRAKLLVLRNVDVHYEAVQVLFGVDLDVQDGELIALLGTNGAGKSTLLRAISGTQEASGGAIVFDGRDITHVPPHEIAGYGVAQTPGGRGIFPGLTVRENLQLAGWLYGEDAGHADDVEQVYQYFPVLREKLEQTAGSMSGGEQQMLTLAQAFLARPKLLMIDELSLGLSPAIVEQLLGIVDAIHQRGTTIIIVEQSVNVALTVAKRAVFMEKGEVRFDGPTEELLGRPDIMRAVFLKGGKTISLGATATPETRMRDEERVNILEARGLVKRYGGVAAVNGVSFALREQESLGLIGPNGAGKTTVLEMISGFNPVDEGQVIYENRDITLLPPDERAKIGMIRRFQDARLFPSLTVAETIAIAFERQIQVRSMIVQALALPQARTSEANVKRKVERLIELLGLEAYRDKFVSEVSTGTRRIIDLACVLAAEPKVLMLDEPSSGLAQREAENMAPLLQQVRRETGCSMIIIEHDMPLISAVSDELLAMDLGQVVVRGTPEAVLNDPRVVQAYLGTSEETIRRSGRVEGK
jgi:ABC-type branched-subunit amino acid transport system ATPase component/sugar phosphate permease